jgi:hypothetical protein
VQGDGSRGHLADEDRPQVGAIGAPVLQGEHGVEFPACGVDVAGAGIESGSDGVCMCRGADPPAHRLCRHVLQFCWLVPGANGFKSLGHAHVAGVTLADVFAEGGSLSRQPFTVSISPSSSARAACRVRSR